MEEGRLVLAALLAVGKDWIDAFEALATPIIAGLAALFAYRGYALERAKRRDELFDRRWKFYYDFKSFWLSTGEGAPPNDPGDAPIDILSSWAEEAEILFGKEVGAAIANLPEEGHSGGGGRFIEPSLAELFISRMRLE